MTTDPGGAPGSGPRFRRHLAWAALYLVLAVVRLAPLSLHPASRLADDGDALLEAWVLWWGGHHVLDGIPRVFDANAFFPHAHGLLYAEAILPQAAFAAPLLRFLPAAPALNLITVATFALSAFGFHLLARTWVGDRAAAVGAVLWAFNSYALSNVPRLPVVSLGWMPLALLALHRFFESGHRRHGALFALFSLLHGLSCFYYLMFYLVLLAIVIPAYLTATRSWTRKGPFAVLAAVALACAALLAPVVVPYIRLYRQYGFVGETRPFDLLLYLTPPRESLLYRGLGQAMRPPGYYLDYFLGYGALVLAIVGVGAVAAAWRRERWRALWAAWLAVGLAGIVFSAGVDVRWHGAHVTTGPFALLRHLSPFATMREPRRFAMLALFSLALFAARGAAAVLARVIPRLRVAAAATLALAVMADQATSSPTRGTEVPAGSSVPDVYTWLSARPGEEPVAELPVRPPHLLRFMSLDQYLSTFHGKPITTGWPSFFPPALELLLWDTRDFPDLRSITLLRGLGVRLAVIHPKRWEAERRHYERRLAEREDVLPLLARFPDRDLQLWQRYQLGEEQVRALLPLAEEGAPRVCSCVEIDRRHLRAEASSGTGAQAAIDGSRETRWTTGEGQREGMFFELVFDHPLSVARIEVEMTHPYGEFARYLRITGYRGSTAEEGALGPLPDTWYELALLRQLVRDPASARLRYDLRPTLVDRLRLSIERTVEGAPPWSLAEVHVYELAPSAAP